MLEFIHKKLCIFRRHEIIFAFVLFTEFLLMNYYFLLADMFFWLELLYHYG